MRRAIVLHSFHVSVSFFSFACLLPSLPHHPQNRHHLSLAFDAHNLALNFRQ